jgi:4-amino-4-deoxy-L-arabinose transferase-like glycosyltransferase
MDSTITGSAPAPALPATPRTRHRLAWDCQTAVWLVAALAFGVEMAVSARYGYDRDELYFLAAGQHLSLGYVDQPVLTPLLARLDSVLTGDTLVGLRALPALGLSALVLLTAAMARVLGASRRGELLAALAAACCGVYIGAMHELTTTAPDLVCWAATLLLVLRLLKTGNPRWWVAIGACAGAGMSAKWNIGFLVAALLVGFLCSSSARPLLRSRWFLAGAVLFVLLASPDFVWQAQHGWPAFGVFGSLQQSAGSNRLMYWPLQILNTSVLLAPLWIRGAWWSLRDQRYRTVGIATAGVIVLQFGLGGKSYYPDAAYTFLFAAGAASLGSLEPRALRWRAVLYSVAGVIAVLLSLPVVPAATLATVPLQKINYDLGEEIGWPSQVALVARVYNQLPSAERPVAAVITANYGEAGAIERYGSAYGLPEAYSGNNAFWFWGPPPARDTAAIAVGVNPGLLRRDFAQVREVAVYRNGLGVSDDEEGTPIYVASGLRVPWSRAWPAFRAYG